MSMYKVIVYNYICLFFYVHVIHLILYLETHTEKHHLYSSREYEYGNSLSFFKLVTGV